MFTGYTIRNEGEIFWRYVNTGFRIVGNKILEGDRETGYSIFEGVIRDPSEVETEFWISGGIIHGPGIKLPFME